MGRSRGCKQREVRTERGNTEGVLQRKTIIVPWEQSHACPQTVNCLWDEMRFNMKFMLRKKAFRSWDVSVTETQTTRELVQNKWCNSLVEMKGHNKQFTKFSSVSAYTHKTLFIDQTPEDITCGMSLGIKQLAILHRQWIRHWLTRLILWVLSNPVLQLLARLEYKTNFGVTPWNPSFIQSTEIKRKDFILLEWGICLGHSATVWCFT